jgi:hypothetical protein
LEANNDGAAGAPSLRARSATAGCGVPRPTRTDGRVSGHRRVATPPRAEDYRRTRGRLGASGRCTGWGLVASRPVRRIRLRPWRYLPKRWLTWERLSRSSRCYPCLRELARTLRGPVDVATGPRCQPVRGGAARPRCRDAGIGRGRPEARSPEAGLTSWRDFSQAATSSSQEHEAAESVARWALPRYRQRSTIASETAKYPPICSPRTGDAGPGRLRLPSSVGCGSPR